MSSGILYRFFLRPHLFAPPSRSITPPLSHRFAFIFASSPCQLLTNVFVESEKRCWKTHGGGESATRDRNDVVRSNRTQMTEENARNLRRIHETCNYRRVLSLSLSLSRFLSFFLSCFLRFGDRAVSELFDTFAENGASR